MNYTYPYPAVDWTPEGGYPSDSPPTGNPWRPFGAGKSMGLSIILDAELDDYYCSSTASIGFKVNNKKFFFHRCIIIFLNIFQLLLHNPVETPKISDFAYFLTPGLETRVEILPQISQSTPNLRNIRMVKLIKLHYY